MTDDYPLYVKWRYIVEYFIDILHGANLYMEKLRALMQISVNKKYISLQQYEHVSREINEAGKMLGGWIKSCGA